MPDKKFYVQIPGTTQGMSVSAEDFEAKKDKLFNTYKDAVAVEMQDYTNGEDVGDSDFVVTIPGTTEPMQINAADFAKKKDKLFEQYPDAKVTRVRGVNYWGNKLQEGEERIRSLEEELKGIPEDVPLSEDPRVIQGGSIPGMQKLMLEKQRREAPNRARRGEIKQEIEQIKRDREENPAWQQYWEQQGKENDEARARIGQLQKRHTDIMNEHSLDSALAAGDDDYLRIADRFYQDAKKMIDAPSKYADDNQGALGDFWQGIKDTGWNAVSLVDLAHKLHEIPFLETVKKIQKSEGNNANVYDLIKNHTDRLYEMGMGDAEVEMLKAFVHKADVESGKSDLLTKSYQAGQSMAKSLGFMADFIAFGGIGDAASEAVAGGLVKLAGRRAVPKLAAESFGGLVKAAAMTPLMPSTYANFIGNLEQFNDAGGIDLSGKAMLKDVGDILIENVSETIGAKPLELIGMPLQKVKFPAWAKAMRNSPIAGALKQAGYNGFFEEMFEEWTGSALRTMTGVDKDALKDFWQVDQILVTAGSFAPVALLGGSVSAAQFHTASKSMRDKGAVIDGIIGGLQDENAKNAIKDSFDKTRDIETPEDLAHAMTDVYQQIVQNGGNEEQAFKAVMDYTEAASRYKVMNGMFEEQKDIERSQKLAEMDQQMGNTKWHHLGKNGSSYVRTITDDQGNERFVTGEDDTNLLVVDRQGKPGFISKESLATGVEDGTLTDSGEQYLFDYLDKQNRAVKQQEEQVRMVDEKKAAHEEVMRRALPDTPVNPEKPEEGIFRGIVGGRYVIQYPDGSSQDFSEEEIANKLGIRTVPETDAEIEAKDDAHEEKLENMHTAMNQFKGRHIVLPGIADMGYTLTGVVRNRNSESYPFSVFFRDADGHESGTGVSEEDMDALLAEMQAEQPEVQVPDVEPEVEVADNIPRDFRGNPLPMRQNEQTGETVVDEDALRERDIEAWVRYNDANPNRVVSSRDWLAFNIKKTASEVTKAADEITNAELNGVPARQKDAMKKALADKEKLLQSYESAMQRLTTPEDVIGDMPSYIADDQQPEAKEPAAAPSVRDFRGNPIPMADESEVDETAFFQQDPEAWMEWNNAQMNDGGEDSRNYVKGEIGRENKNIARLQKEYNGEKDFKKRKELRKKIQDAQQRIADLEQAVENVEKRMQRRSARELEPQSVDEVIALGIANSKGSIDRDELKRETGMSDADLEGFVGGFVKEGGMSIGQLAEAIKANDDTHLTDSISDDELRSDIIEFLRGSTKWSDITNYIANKRAVQKAEEERQVQEAIAAGATEETDENSIIAVLRAIAQKGKEYARSIFGQRFFDVVETPSFLKDLGLTGQRFTISYGVIARHVGKDSSHDLTEEEWNQLPEAIQHPFAVSEYYPEGIESGKQRGYRIYTTIKKGNGYIVVGVDVKSMGRDMEINSISTVFSKDTRAGEKERFIYKVQNLTPEQEALLNEPNSQTYLPEQEQVSEVESVPTIGNGSSTKAVEVNRGNTEGATTTSGDSSTTSENKDSEISETQANISEEEAKVDTEPTEAQKEAGNYRKGHIKLDGYNISIEQPKGSIRSGIDEQGNPWSVTMNNTYGYIRGTEGVDGDHIDVFLSDNPEEGDIFVVDQIKPDGSFDEHKVMFGFPDMEAARKAYLSNYSEGWQGLGAITAVSREEFKKWVESSHRKTKPFSEYKSVTAEGEQHEESSTADQEEGSETVGYSVERRFHKKNGNYIYALSFKDRLSKDEFKELKNRVKDFGGYYSSYGKGGFIFDKEDSARKFGDAVMDHTGEKLEEARPVSMEDIVQADAAAVQQTDETSQELGIDASMPVSYKGDGKPHTILMVTKTGEQVGAARFSKGRITTVVLNDLDNPGKMIYAKPEDIAQYVVPDIVPEEVNGYKAGDQVMYRDSAGLSSEIIDHFEKYGDTWFPVFKKKDGGRVQIGVWANVSPYVEQVEQNLQSEGSMEKPVNPSGNKLVTDEKYEELRRRMLAKLNGQMNMGIDPEILSIGVQMAVYHVEKGARKFVDFAKNMIADLGDAIRPYLKAFYNGARDLPEVEDAGLASEMTPYDEVRTFDVANFDKAVSNPIETAAEVVKEQEVQQQKEVAEKEIKKTRKSRKSSQNVLSLSLADGTSFTVDRSDYHTFLTPQAKEFFERLAKEDGRNFAFPELAYITYASENNVIIPASELEALPEFIEAERRIAEIGALAKERTGSEALAISEDQVHALADRLLEEGSYVGKKDYSGEVAREKKAFVIIGRPAAGKSSVFANPLSKEHKARIIDSDTVKPWLEGYDGGYGANYVHGASVRVADEALIRAASLGENIIIPRIGGRSIISETVLPLRAVGYSVELCYNELPTEGSIMRAAARFVQTGRYLSLQYLNAIGEKPINTYRKFVTKSIGETINELSEREIQELRRRLGRLLGVEDRMAGASGPGGREVLSGVPETLGEGFRALLEHGEFGSDPSSDLLVFDGSEWKNNDVDYGIPPVTVWSSKSGEPFPGPKEGPKDNKNIKPSKKMHADEGMTLFDMMEENNNENEPETTDSTQGEGSPDRAMGGVSAVGDRVLGTDGSGQSDGTEAGGNRAGEPGVAGEEPQLLSTVGSGRGSESVVDSGSQGQPELSDGGPGVQGRDSEDGRKAVRRDSQKAGQKKGVSKPAKKFTRNFHYGENASEIDNYTPAQRLKANIDAVEVLATMFSEGRPATDEEKETLSKFRGWGGIPFGHYYSTRQLRDSYSSDAHRLADAIDVLDPNGEKGLLPAISKAALTSYYTPSAIARTMNRFLALSGFKGGSMLDPSMGSGIFEGTLPEDIQQRTMINGVELDWLTGQIAKALYPDANVQIKGFEDAGTAMDAFDVVESNIPFGSIKVFDPTWKHDSTPVRKAAQGKIHNYFAVKMLESTKPGGLCVIMTSNAILDTEGNSLIREHIADQAEVLGIVRLPDNTFKGAGTSAVTDVLFLRKFRDSDDRNTTRDEEKYRTRVLQPFLSMTTKDAAKKTDGSSVKVSYNGYFGTHPEFMIGDVIAGNQYKADAFGLTSNMSTDEIADAMDKILEKKIVGSRKGKLFDTTKSEREVHEAIRESYVGNGDYISSGNIVEQDGKFGVVSMSKNKYGDVERNFQELPRLNGKAARIQAMFPIRTTMKKLVAEQIAGASNDTLDGLRKQLKESYDKFVKLYGRLQDSENTFLDDDIDGYMLRSLEKWREGEFVGLSDIFTKNTIKPAIDLSQAQDGQSAISVSLAEYGEIRPAFMEQMLGEKWYDLCKEMVFRIPFSEDRYETKDAYLSGDVKTKLEQARKAAETDRSFQRNVDELEAVQPKDIPFDDISVHMGARWIPQEIYTQFLVDSFGISSWRGPKSGVLYSEVSDTYIVNVASSELGGAAQKWATRRRNAKDIFEAALSDKTIKVVDKDDEGKEYLNVAETEAANEKVQELRESFEDWLPKNAERVKQVAALYNDKFNRTVLRKFDGSHLKTPGLMGMELRPHQKDAVWMLINNRGGIVDHMVGAGKTLVMQSAIMEMRRMGIAKKPMIVALKSTVAQITKEFIEAYPSARILAPTEKDFEKKRRKELLAKIALNDYDCVIISHENYVGLPHTEEVETQVIREQLAQLDAAIQFLYGQEDQSQLTKRQLKGLEKRKANLEAKMQALLSRKVDREFTFESLGVDYLFVDECQAFKSLPYVTSYQNVAGLGDAAGSQKAVALLNGVRYLQSLHQGDMGTTFLSGTTITNSLVEIYNLLQYLRPREMESLGFTTFDAWAGTFAQRSGELEYGVTQELKEKNRFRRFDNVPELARLYAEIADVRNDMNLKLPKPKPRMHIVTVPASEKLKEINAEVINMVRNKSGNYFYNMGAIKKPTTDKSPFGLLASGISTKAAISMKLLDPNAEEEGGKIHAVCENVAEIYKKFNDQKGTQLIFCDTGVPTKESKYDVYTDIIGRLVNDYGIPRDEIVDIHVADTDKKRKELFTKVREGTVRVLIGGTKNMGTGVNVQTRLVALHHIDVPWTPADREQREGRGVRQGNIVAREFNDDNVDIYFYAAEESLDLYKYQLQDTKGKMFTQFKQGTIGSTERSFDEGSGGEDGTFDPAEIVALLSGNPVILEKSKQDKKVEKLRRAKRTFESEWNQRKSQYDSLLSYLYTQENFLRQNKRDIDSLEAGGFKKMEDGKYPTTVTVEDYSDYGTRRTFDKPKEAGEYIHKLLKKKGASVRLSGFGQKANIQMAEVASPLSGVPAYEWQVVLQAWSGIPYRAQLSEDDTAAGVAFRNVLQKVFSNRETYQKNIDETKHKLEGADPGEMVFPKQAELDEAEAKKKELDAQYKALAPKEEKKPASSENPEESVSLQHYDINLEGTPEEKSENIHRTSVGEDLGTVGRRTGEVPGRDNDYGVWRRSYDISDGTGPGAGRISLDNLERLFRDTNINQEIVPLFEKVIALAKENGVIKTYFRTPKSGEIRGQAMYTGDVYFNPSILTAPEYTGESAVTILHELIHGLTISTLRSHELGNKLRKYGLNPDGRLTAEQKAAAKEIERIYKRLHDNLDTSRMSKEQKKMLNYRLVNQYEMVAGMSDQRFRDYLRSVEDGPTNLWERLKAAIKRILGIESGDTLTRLEKALDNLLDNFRIETFEDTSGLQTNEGFEHYSVRETSDSRAIAGSLYDRYENQNGEDMPWMSEEDLFERVESELPYDRETKPLFALIDEYRRLSDEDFEEGRRDFSGGDMSDLFSNFLSALKSYSEEPQVRNRFAGVEGFISNAEAAVNAIKQEKATPEQWLKMIEKNGGLKAGEDKWLGLSDWLKASDKKSITKQEVLDFIDQNKIRIEETRYAENPQVNDEVAQIAYRINDRYDELASEDLDMDEIYDTLLREFPEMEKMEEDGRLILDEDAIGTPMYRPGNPAIKESNKTRLYYTTNGLSNKKEIALTVPSIESWNENDNVHFGDAGQGRAVAWVRYGDARTEDGGKVLFIDEIQSKRHQEGREKGYSPVNLSEYQRAIDYAFNQRTEYFNSLREKYSIKDAPVYDLMTKFEKKATREEFVEAARLNQACVAAMDAFNKASDTGIPAAPFEKNWHELAMKRMLRLAAEEGYDYVAWTTGEQQAERYNLSNAISNVYIKKSPAASDLYFVKTFTNSGDIITDASGDMTIDRVGEVFGKDLGARLIKEADDKNGEEAVINGDGLRIGGEGMKGFYDDILPRFVNKYAKKWGVKVRDEVLFLSDGAMLETHTVPVTTEMKESVMEGQLMFREGNTQSPVQYSESISGKREAVNRVAELCGVEIEFKPSSEMRFKGKPLAGRWINGRMQVCLEHCRDEADAVRTVLHEGVGHNGLRRLIGNENMREFCLELFQRLPEQARKQIADAAVNKYGLNIAEAVEEYLAEQAEVMDFENGDYSRSFWDVVRDALRKVLSKIGIDVFLSERDVRWLMWQSYNANKQRDPLNEVKRQVVANKLGFTLTQQADKMEGIQIARNRVAQEDELDAATDAYNEAAASLWNRMKETFVDQYQSVGKLVSAIEDATGKKAASFEDIRLALNRHSSKALATMQQWIGKYNTPMWDAIKELREKIGGTVNDVSRYVMLKHGLERNEVFAKRDAREYYQGIRDRAVNEIKATKDLSKDEKDQRIAKEDDRLEKHLKAIEAGTNAKYREFRQRDYGGLTSFYSEFDEVDPQRPGEGKERYNARLQKARHPKYTTVDENGRVVVDMAATEKAAADEVAAFERQSEGLTDKLWQRINAATKATLEHQYQSNMLSRKQYEQVRDMFKYYVPLRGFEDDTAQDLYSYYNEDQRGNFEKPLIRAAGRKTRAESPFGHIGAMASSGIAADMKNETKLSLYYFVSNRPNDLVTISDVWYEKTGETDEDGREVFKAVYPSFSEDLGSEEAKKAFDDWEDGMKEKAKSGLAFKGRKNLDLHNAVIHIDKGQKTEHVVKFKVGGRDMMMYINGNPRAAQAINGELNYNAENNFFVRAFNAVLRTMAALNTALNPEFWISNFQRDALFSLMSVDVKEGSKYRDAFAKNLVSGKTIFKMKKAFDEGTLGDSKDEQLFREFAENGGITGYTVVYDNEYWEKKLDEYAGKDRNVVARFNDVFKSISDFGEAVEIRTRFAAYKTSREMGKDIIGSVNDAKELTVNFNRKGSGKAITLDEAAKLTWRNGKPLSKPWQLVASMFSSISPLGRRMIMFFNAAVQGLNAMVKLYKTNPKRMAVWTAGYLAVGMINAVLHSMLDDDDDYLDIPDWERRNNLLLGGKGAYLKWALPQEARVFYALGDMVVNHALGREPHKYLAVELLDVVGEALPIDVASGVGAFLPSAAMPVIDIVRNKDYKGAKVHNDRRFYSEEERKDIPKWRDPLANTGGLYVGLAKVISRITGGDEYGAGWWNPDPNDIEHLVEGYTGGLGTTVEKMLQFFGDIAGGEFVVRDTPFLRRILSLNDERYRNTHTTELYYYYTNRAKDTKRKIREARKNGDADKLDDLYESDDFEIMNICESYDGLLKWYSDELKFTDDKQDRKAIMHEQDAVRKEMIQEISNIGKQ